MTVLDAYAVIALLRGEPAAAEVQALLRQPTTIASVNLAEVVDNLVRVHRHARDDVDVDLLQLESAGLGVLTVDRPVAAAAGWLRARHYHRERRAVSLADCMAAATSLASHRPLATSDPHLAAVVREEGGEVVALADSRGRRP